MLPGPTKGDCECVSTREVEDGSAWGCGLFGTLGRPDRHGRRHVRGCPCKVCLGRRARRSGVTKQRVARRALGISGPSLGADHEENWRGRVRVEVKSGHRESVPVQTRFLACEAQSEAARSIGDNRPFMAIFMPPGTSDGLVVIRLSQLAEVARCLTEED
jgi:hypothetical protein